MNTTGIYVLQTPLTFDPFARIHPNCEYRVAPLTDLEVDSLFQKTKPDDEGNPYMVVLYFKDSPVFQDQKSAVEEAQKMSDQFLESSKELPFYGTLLIELPFSFTDYQKQAQQPQS